MKKQKKSELKSFSVNGKLYIQKGKYLAVLEDEGECWDCKNGNPKDLPLCKKRFKKFKPFTIPKNYFASQEDLINCFKVIDLKSLVFTHLISPIAIDVICCLFAWGIAGGIGICLALPLLGTTEDLESLVMWILISCTVVSIVACLIFCRLTIKKYIGYLKD